MPLFQRADSVRAEARSCLGALHQAEDAPQFQTAFNAFVRSARSVTFALQKDGGTIDGFLTWYEEMQEEMRADPLLRFFNDARTGIDKRGEQFLEIHAPEAEIDSGYSTTKRVVRGTIHESGPFGTVERPDIAPQPKITVKDPPRIHKGAEIADPNPISLCELVLDYLEGLVGAAEREFSRSGSDKATDL